MKLLLQDPVKWTRSSYIFAALPLLPYWSYSWLSLFCLSCLTAHLWQLAGTP